MDAGAGDINDNYIYVPILGPASSGVLGDGPSQPINLDLLHDKLQLKVTVRAGDKVSKTNPLVISEKPVLFFRNWTVQEDLKPLLNKFSFLDITNGKITPETITQSTEFSKQITNVFDQTGNKECIGLFVRLVTNANLNTEFEEYIGQEIQRLRLEVDNLNIYEHTNSQDAKLQSLFDSGSLPYDSNSTSWQYFIPFKHEELMNSFESKGTSGISLARVIPTLHITSSTNTGTHYLFLTAVNKCNFLIEVPLGEKRGYAKLVY